MLNSVLDEHYEDEFEYQLLKMIKQRAKKKDISYLAAAEEIIPEYAKTIRYRDTAYENSEVEKRAKEMAELVEREKNG